MPSSKNSYKEVAIYCTRCGRPATPDMTMIEKPDGTLETDVNGKLVIKHSMPNTCSYCGSGLIRKVTRDERYIKGLAALISVDGKELIKQKFNRMKGGETWHIRPVGVVFKKIGNHLRLETMKVSAPATKKERKRYVKDFTKLAQLQDVKVI